MSAPAALIFDFDGVIVESSEVKAEAFAALYRPFGEEAARRAAAHHRANGGVSRVEKFRFYHREFLGLDLSAEELAALARRFAEIVEDKVVACPAVPGASETLAFWRGRAALFVASATPQDELRRIVARRGLDACFDGVYGGPTAKTALTAEIVARHRLDPAATAMIGDAAEDYRAATAAGLRFVGRVPPGGLNPFPSDTKIIPDLRPLACEDAFTNRTGGMS